MSAGRVHCWELLTLVARPFDRRMIARCNKDACEKRGNRKAVCRWHRLLEDVNTGLFPCACLIKSVSTLGYAKSWWHPPVPATAAAAVFRFTAHEINAQFNDTGGALSNDSCRNEGAEATSSNETRLCPGARYGLAPSGRIVRRLLVRREPREVDEPPPARACPHLAGGATNNREVVPMRCDTHAAQLPRGLCKP